VLLLTTATLVPNHSQRHAATPPRRPIFDSPPSPQGWTTMRESVKATCQGLRSSRSMHDSTLPETRTTRSRRAPSTLRGPYLVRYLAPQLAQLSLRLAAVWPKGPPFTCLLEPFPQPQDNLTSSGLKSACGFVHFRSLVHASLCPPHYEPTRPVSSSRRDQTEDATLRSSRVSCVPGHPHTSANARHRPLGPDDAKARAAAHTDGEGTPNMVRSKGLWYG
jgi:hypothetical protein